MYQGKGVAFDAAPSQRATDENGFLHVGASHITKATVNPYYGREIPGWREAGLDPEAVYYGLRDPEELQASLETWAGLPLHIEHHIDSADEPEKLTRVGAVGTGAVWNPPYVDASLTVWDRAAIEAIEDGSFRELSCAYRYDPDFTSGTHEGVAYDFIMRNIRGNHVALVEEGRAGPDVVVADSHPTSTKKGTLMGKFRKWFRGAQDDGPDIERQEVELAQAIIDLHKVDPVTGEIVDLTEDEDKAEEIRKLVGELSAKLDPEDVKKLTDSLSDLAYSRTTGDGEPEKKEAMDEETRKAMDACGLDAEDPTESRAFAKGVTYGEELERNPDERGKLDREHESEGMRKAMDACGLDAENPQESRAFAEGTKYGGERVRNPGERRKLDAEHEREGMTGDEDKNAAVERILASVPGLTPEQKKKLEDSLADLAYSPATGDANPDDKGAAQDRAFRRRPRPLTAMDAARIKASAIAEAQEHMRALSGAVRDVRGLVGELDPLSFDSASDVYGYALEQLGETPRKYPRQAWRGMIDVLRRQKSGTASFARDAARTLDHPGHAAARRFRRAGRAFRRRRERREVPVRTRPQGARQRRVREGAAAPRRAARLLRAHRRGRRATLHARQRRRLHRGRAHALQAPRGGRETELRFFRRKPVRLPRRSAYRQAAQAKGLADFANVGGLTGSLIARRAATLHELDTVYGYEDALNLAEVLLVTDYNEWAMHKQTEERHGNRH